MRLGDFTDYLKNKLLEHLTGRTAFTMPTLFLFLSSTDPRTTITEPTGGSYARVETDAADWAAAASGVIASAQELAFPTPAESWGAMSYWGGADAGSGGNALVAGRLGKVMTTLAEQLAYDDTTITLTDASSMPASGTIIIEDEEITYTGVSTNDLTGCTRGAAGTTATAHAQGHEVFLCLPKTIGIGDAVRWAAGELKVRADYSLA